jgi:hypothetical protein
MPRRRQYVPMAEHSPTLLDLVAYGLQGVRVRLCTIKVILSPRERNSKLRNC